MRICCGLLLSVIAVPVLAQDLIAWPVDPLIKVFRDAGPQRGKALAEVARGEHASLQVVVRSESPITNLRAEIIGFKRRWGKETIAPLAPRFVGYVPVDRPTQRPSSDQLRKPPADYPDPLLEVDSIDVPAGAAQPIWITTPVPVNTRPGLYRGELRIAAEVDGAAATARTPLSIRVYPVTVEKTRLWVTDWFVMHSLHMDIHPEPDSEEYYALLARYARNLAEHRHNVALISPLALAEFTATPVGGLEVDWTRFDRWVEVFQREGVIGLIEGGHIGGRSGEWESPFIVGVRRVEDGKVTETHVDPASEEAERFYSWYFPQLVRHLREKGWLDMYVQHLADEPIESNIDSYRAMADLVRKYAPELRIIEACHTKDLVGAMDIWVPQLNYLHRDFEHYRERQEAGDEVWFYTCVFPQGEYANRFIELPLIKTRLLHWINFRFGITGYLHWGYNHWTQDSPFTQTTRPHPGPPYLPAGDAWIVYPGRVGPLDSIRFEAMRDGIVDHELLSMLAERDPEKAQDVAVRHVHDFDLYDTDVELFRETRRYMLMRLSPTWRGGRGLSYCRTCSYGAGGTGN